MRLCPREVEWAYSTGQWTHEALGEPKSRIIVLSSSTISSRCEQCNTTCGHVPSTIEIEKSSARTHQHTLDKGHGSKTSHGATLLTMCTLSHTLVTSHAHSDSILITPRLLPLSHKLQTRIESIALRQGHNGRRTT